MPFHRNFERVGISIITFMLASLLGIACGSLGVYRMPVQEIDPGPKPPATEPSAVPSPLVEATQVIVGHQSGTMNEQSFYISGLPKAAEPFAKVVAMDTLGHMAITTAKGDGSFMIKAVPPGFEVSPGHRLLLSQIVPHLGESVQVPVRISGF